MSRQTCCRNPSTVNWRATGTRATRNDWALDPATPQVFGGHAKNRRAASVSQIACFNTEIPTTKKNVQVLTDSRGTCIDRARRCCAREKLALDLDNSVSEANGPQGASA